MLNTSPHGVPSWMASCPHLRRYGSSIPRRGTQMSLAYHPMDLCREKPGTTEHSSCVGRTIQFNSCGMTWGRKHKTRLAPCSSGTLGTLLESWGNRRACYIGMSLHHPSKGLSASRSTPLSLSPMDFPFPSINQALAFVSFKFCFSLKLKFLLYSLVYLECIHLLPRLFLPEVMESLTNNHVAGMLYFH